MNTHQVRRLPKKTVIIISILIAFGFIIFYVIKDLKEKKKKVIINITFRQIFVFINLKVNFIRRRPL